MTHWRYYPTHKRFLDRQHVHRENQRLAASVVPFALAIATILGLGWAVWRLR